MSSPVVYNIVNAVTPSDTVDLPAPGPCDALWVGGAGNIAVVMDNQQIRIINAVPAGAVLPIKVRRVNATTTTATNILALYDR